MEEWEYLERTQGSLQGRNDGHSPPLNYHGWIQSWEPHQRDVPVLCIPGIPHRKVTPSLTIISMKNKMDIKS
ncbi:unnamed protein product [Staurois parvus]|uniref:Uncharacterized protein n=1 Tax=Staurois parvus TaxID=386267 RepID=A0ABN9D1A0_9NEOB|nr:unnamed protein product [Staurois parvus]